jgi:hypothetical protein
MFAGVPEYVASVFPVIDCTNPLDRLQVCSLMHVFVTRLWCIEHEATSIHSIHLAVYLLGRRNSLEFDDFLFRIIASVNI